MLFHVKSELDSKINKRPGAFSKHYGRCKDQLRVGGYFDYVEGEESLIK